MSELELEIEALKKENLELKKVNNEAIGLANTVEVVEKKLAELTKENLELKKVNNEAVGLANTIEAREKEISKMKDDFAAANVNRNKELDKLKAENKQLKEVNDAAIGLAKTLEAREKEIGKLTNTIAEINLKRDEEVAALRTAHTAALDSKTKEASKVKSELETFKQQFEVELNKRASTMKTQVEVEKKDLENKVKFLSDFGDMRTAQLQELIGIHNALLKQLQGTLDNTILLSEYFDDKLKRGV